MQDYKQLEEKQQALLYALGVTHDLIDKGMIDGPRIMTAEGTAMFRQMQADEWRPENDLFDWAIHAVMSHGTPITEEGK